METADLSYQINAQSVDRFGFGLFIAAAVHACLIFGVVFDSEELQSSIADMEITLVTHFSQDQPEDADFWAQENQQASGTKEEALMMTSPDTKALPGENDSEGLEMQQLSIAAEDPGLQVVSTLGQSEDVEQIDIDAPEESHSSQSEEAARREANRARLDILRQEYARRPKLGVLTSQSAKAREDAEYQLHLQERIIELGNANYPAASLREGVFGSLRLKLTILPDGTLEFTEILESSGKLMLDQAAVEIARLSAPFNGFPSETAKRYDKIIFIRTWQFLPGGRLKTSE